MKKLRKDSGMAGLILIELLAAMTIIALLASQAGVSFVRVQAAQNFDAAKMRVLQVSQAVNAENICLGTPPCVPSPGITNQIPAYGTTLSQGGYNYTMTDNGGGNWSYVATPYADGQSGMGSVYVDQTGVMRCQPVNQGIANGGSLPCT